MHTSIPGSDTAAKLCRMACTCRQRVHSVTAVAYCHCRKISRVVQHEIHEPSGSTRKRETKSEVATHTLWHTHTHTHTHTPTTLYIHVENARSFKLQQRFLRTKDRNMNRQCYHALIEKYLKN